VKNKNRIRLLVVTAVLLILFNIYLSSNYTVMAPGITIDLKDIVTVEGGHKKAQGSFFLTTVSSRSLNIPLLFYAAVSPYVNIEQKEAVIPEGWSMNEYIDYMQKWMQESQKIAEVVALRKAGYEPKIYGDGAQVVEIMPESPAQGKLFSGDIITEVDGKKVNLADEVVKIVSDHAINEDVEFKVKRNNKTHKILIPTIESKSEKGRAIVGIYITTFNWKPILPLKIDIETGDIGGPSAGSMFAMEILNQLTDDDITRGYKIAGTGTISLDEKIGEIGGVEQKVVSAHRDGAKIFFCPEKNASDARKIARNFDIKIVPVKELDDIITYLEDL
jgi:PDZ domain-containing protein